MHQLKEATRSARVLFPSSAKLSGMRESLASDSDYAAGNDDYVTERSVFRIFGSGTNKMFQFSFSLPCRKVVWQMSTSMAS